jgi:hypothetical protein
MSNEQAFFLMIIDHNVKISDFGLQVECMKLMCFSNKFTGSICFRDWLKKASVPGTPNAMVRIHPIIKLW